MSNESIKILKFFKVNNHTWMNRPYVSKYTGLPKNIVYGCMVELEARGMIKKYPNHPFYMYNNN